MSKMNAGCVGQVPPGAPVAVHAVAVDEYGQSILPPPPPPLGNVPYAPSFRAVPDSLDEGVVREYLSQHQWPRGLQNVLINSLSKIPLRYFLCDDSGSMIESDGHQLVNSSAGRSVVSCSRWEELTTCLKFHVGLAHACQTPTEFRLLNGSAPILIGRSHAEDITGMDQLNCLFGDSPGGMTPLCGHIRQIIAQIAAIAPQLRANGQKAALIIATDGEASDGDIASAMQPLCTLPVWVVIRLCTDDEKVVRYWNEIDSQLELDMDVIDDYLGEAGEVYAVNNWLTYGEPIHRLREFGVSVKEFDLLDESSLTIEQMKSLCSTLFGVPAAEFPHPEADWNGFLHMVENLNNHEPFLWNVKVKSPQRWIVIPKLKARYQKKGCVIV